MMTLQKSCWTLQMPMPICSTSRQTARWTMAWNWFPTLALWTITSTSFHGRISCTVPFSHQTSTCGLHLHVNRNAFSDNQEEQDEVISRILYFVEHHWNELLKFSRRSEYAMNRWAARYGYEHTPKAIMDKAKKGGNGRYAAVNLCNYHTVEFRLFRGTLKYNTFIATIQLVNRICDAAMYNTDDSIAKLSWSDFVADVTEPELIQYLKERQLYINDRVEETEEY